MKTYAKLGIGLLVFGFFLSVLGAIAIRTQAPIIDAMQAQNVSQDTSKQSGVRSEADQGAPLASKNEAAASAAVQKPAASKP